MNDTNVFEQADSTLNQLDQIEKIDALQAKSKIATATQRSKRLADRLVWLSDLKEGEESEVKWVCKGLCGRGLITLLSGSPKDGKTTFISHLLLAMELGEDFLGLPVENVKTLIITEENQASWYRKKFKLSLKGASAGLITRYLYDKNQRGNWSNAIDELRDLCVREEIGLVVFDTIGHFWGISSENDATEVLNALKPLHMLSEAGISVLLIHHDRKAGGTIVKGVRGSSALTGFPDIILGLTKSESKSTLTGDGRYEETPSKLTFKLTEDESRLELLETSEPINTSMKQKLEDALPLIPYAPEGITKDELAQKLIQLKGTKSPHQSSFSRWLGLGEELGLVKVVGRSEQRGKPELWGRVFNEEVNHEDDFEPTT